MTVENLSVEILFCGVPLCKTEVSFANVLLSIFLFTIFFMSYTVMYRTLICDSYADVITTVVSKTGTHGEDRLRDCQDLVMQ